MCGGVMANQPELMFAKTTYSPRFSSRLLRSFTTLAISKPFPESLNLKWVAETRVCVP